MDDELKKKLGTGPYHKIIGVPIQKSAEPTDDGSIFVRGRFTSDNPDELGDIITRGATERAIPRYKQWSNIRYMHQPRPVGKVVRIGTSDGLDWNEVEIKVIDPQAQFEVNEGLLAALSVGILINYEDIEYNKDTGGFIINDYMLAEISLVDHPANYDAALDRVKGMVNTIAMRDGREAALKTLEDIRADLVKSAETEQSMPDEHIQEDAVEIQQEEEPVEKSVDAEVIEPVEAVADQEPVVEKAVDAQAEEPVDEIPAGEEDAEVEPVAEEEEQGLNFALKALQDLATEVRALAANVAEMQSTLKTLAEAKSQDQGEVVEAAAEEAAEAASEPVEEEQAGEPANRKGALPETELPSGSPETEDVESDVRPKSDLRSALRGYFAGKTK